MKDKNGKEYAKVADVKVGDKVSVDGDFDCMAKGAVFVVQKNNMDRLFIPCTSGQHYLKGHIDNGDGTHYVGIYPSE